MKKTFFIWLFLVLAFGGLFAFNASGGGIGPIDDISNYQIKNLFGKYHLYAGFVFGFLSATIFLILNLFARLFKKHTCIARFVALVIAILPWVFLGNQLVNHENRYTELGKAVISYIGYPLLPTALFILGLVFVFGVLTLVLKFKKTGKFLTLPLLMILMTGCMSEAIEISCLFIPDSDHCYQSAAVQAGDASGCEKIKGADFADAGSNPPKDKCYMQVAANTGDLGVCENIQGGAFSYTKEECYLEASIKNVNPSGCQKLTGSDKARCQSELSSKVTSKNVLEVDEQIAILKEELAREPDEGLQKQLDELEQKRSDILDVMNDETKNEYASLSDPMNKETRMDYYSGKIDEKTKDALVALNDRLREQGNSMTQKEYETMRDMLAFKNDPNNDIENMDPREIVKLRWDEKLGNGIDYLKFWNSNPTETEKKLDEQLLFYERMLERQAAIEKGLNEKQQDFERNADKVKDYLKDEAWGKAMDYAKEEAFGELLELVNSPAEAPVTAILGEAIDTVKKEAKSKEFRGLVRAYNLGMQEELSKHGGSVEKAHAAVVAKLNSNPYEYEDQNTFAKYGNLIENKSCDGSNPHCIDKDIFWKSMKKSYSYQNSK